MLLVNDTQMIYSLTKKVYLKLSLYLRKGDWFLIKTYFYCKDDTRVNEIIGFGIKKPHYCEILFLISVTIDLVLLSFFIKSEILSLACIIVVWSLPPKSLPMVTRGMSNMSSIK